VKYIDEYRNKVLVDKLVFEIRKKVSRKWTLMEICGGQTHSILKYNLLQLLPEKITLIHGPGCPVCVTPVNRIDQAIALGGLSHVILTSFGDMLRVPGSTSDLLSVKALGGDVRMVHSPLEALDLAEENPEKEVVFFAVGFETTAPAVALTVKQARNRKLLNFSVLVSHVCVPPAIEALLDSEESRIDGFLAAGHVCTVMGTEEYLPIAEKYRVPLVVTGFEPLDILLGIFETVKMLEEGRYGVVNAYTRSVREQGNQAAQELLGEVFESTDSEWRGIGNIPSSGLRLSGEYKEFDAPKRFQLDVSSSKTSGACIAGKILTGQQKPVDCSEFGLGCTPEKPMGAPMVSTEGACAAYYRYQRTTTTP
jgi:hydrogenase expression/formation protein HypD